MSKTKAFNYQAWRQAGETLASNRDTSEPEWYLHLSVDEQEEIKKVYGTLPDMSDYDRLHYFLANFYLLEDQTFWKGALIRDTVRAQTYEKIQKFCFLRGWCPMLTYNKRFQSAFRVEESAPKTPDLSLRVIDSGSVCAYREKKDGVLCWLSAVTDPDLRKIVCYVGGISFPQVSVLQTFELCQDGIFPIVPFNAKGSLWINGLSFPIRPRDLYSSPQDEWVDGAIALVSSGGDIVERRVKSIPSSELEVVNGKVKIFQQEYECQGATFDGIWECTFDGKEVEALRYRPFKHADPGFAQKMLLPDVLNTYPSPYEFAVSIDENFRLSGSRFSYPKCIDLGIVSPLASVTEIHLSVRTNFPITLRTEDSKAMLTFHSYQGTSLGCAVNPAPGTKLITKTYDLTVAGMVRLQTSLGNHLRVRGYKYSYLGAFILKTGLDLPFDPLMCKGTVRVFLSQIIGNVPTEVSSREVVDNRGKKRKKRNGLRQPLKIDEGEVQKAFQDERAEFIKQSVRLLCSTGPKSKKDLSDVLGVPESELTELAAYTEFDSDDWMLSYCPLPPSYSVCTGVKETDERVLRFGEGNEMAPSAFYET